LAERSKDGEVLSKSAGCRLELRQGRAGDDTSGRVVNRSAGGSKKCGMQSRDRTIPKTMRGGGGGGKNDKLRNFIVFTPFPNTSKLG